MRQRIYDVITDEPTDRRSSDLYDWFMTAVILASLLPLCFKGSSPAAVRLEWVTTAIFIVDYLLRWCCADFILGPGPSPFVRYPLTPMAIVDLVSIVPTFVPVSQVLRLSRIVRLLRIMRALKLVHHSRSIQLVARVLNRERDALLAVLVLAGMGDGVLFQSVKPTSHVPVRRV